jgi:D-inositol-3-phosphate glycosyltransferase
VKESHQIQEADTGRLSQAVIPDLAVSKLSSGVAVALLTGGGDRPYAFGLATELISKGLALDIIAGDELDSPEFHGKKGVNFLNLRGDQSPQSNLLRKVFRLSMYYVKLIRYAATAKPRLFHILWNNKFELFDRTFLMLYYKALKKKIVLTIHNVNARKRDSNDTALNRLTLRVQYRLADHIFVHTEQMKRELIEDFGAPSARISVIPFGINNAVPNTSLTEQEARQRLGIADDNKTILFFGNITPYKGLEYLISAFQQVLARCDDYRLIVAGRPKNCERYWTQIKETMQEQVRGDRLLLRANFIPDEETEIYFKAADVLVLPYRQIYQSGVLFLGYSFGLPVLAADVGSLKDEIVEGKTGFVFRPEDPVNLARVIETYFASDLFKDLARQRPKIRGYATGQHSWEVVGQVTTNIYANLLGTPLAPSWDKNRKSISGQSD